MLARVKNEITLWRVIVGIIFVTGIYATYIRFFHGFRASTNLSDQMPWGLWVGLGTLCGVGLSAGGFGIAAAVYLLVFAGVWLLGRTGNRATTFEKLALVAMSLVAFQAVRNTAWLVLTALVVLPRLLEVACG